MMYRASDRERFVPIPSDHSNSWRSCFRQDYGRLIHSPSFRRLQGKTQVFIGLESDFFRNRLTHSIEVAQISKSIGLKLNHEKLEGRGAPLDLELLEIAGLAHDLGHPPFGHLGEAVLHRLMEGNGGFEGNAQTLRILSRLENKLDAKSQLNEDRLKCFQGDKEVSVGLNLCKRTLAAVLKYDQEIPLDITGKVKKGFYSSEAGIVKAVKLAVSDKPPATEFKSIECQIMDLADDIAYSTYDIEDAFKGGLLNPLELLHAKDDLLVSVASTVKDELDLESFEVDDVKTVLKSIFPILTEGDPETLYPVAMAVAEQGIYRRGVTGQLVGEAIESISVDINSDCLPLSRVIMEEENRIKVLVLKYLSRKLIFDSYQLQIVDYRGELIVTTVFQAIRDKGRKLLPDDYSDRYDQARHDETKLRVICDFVAGMTDRYMIEFYARLTSENYQTIFKPL